MTDEPHDPLPVTWRTLSETPNAYLAAHVIERDVTPMLVDYLSWQPEQLEIIYTEATDD